MRFTQNRLPHRQQSGITYFVTFRLADSVPRKLLNRWREERDNWLKWHPEPWNEKEQKEYTRRFLAPFDTWLDEGHGSYLLRDSAVRKLVSGTLMHFDGERHEHHSWVIMPNHVHALFSLKRRESMEKIIHAWKGLSSQAVNKFNGRQGTIWMKDYFDRMIRDAPHFWRCARYIRKNPAKAHLPNSEFTLYESSHVRDVLDGKAAG